MTTWAACLAFPVKGSFKRGYIDIDVDMCRYSYRCVYIYIYVGIDVGVYIYKDTDINVDMESRILASKCESPPGDSYLSHTSRGLEQTD